jgi:hypothetical protein
MPTVIASSLPSLPVTDISIPSMSTFSADFYYNFFTPDELVNEVGNNVDSTNSVQFSRTVPRYVKLTWDKVVAGSSTKIRQDLVDISIAENANKVINEDDFFAKYYSNFQQQEISFVSQTQVYLDQLYKQLGYNRVNASLLDALKALHETTPEVVSEDYLKRYLNYTHSSATTTTPSPVNPLDAIQNISVVQPVSNKIHGTLLYEKVVNDSLMPITSYVAEGLTGKFAVQTSVKQYDNRLNGSQYELTLDNPVDVTVADLQADFGFVFQTTGYIIERYRVQNDNLVEKKTFFIEDPNTVEYFDTQIRYNQRYVYNIKAVITVQTLTFNAEERVNVISSFLVASRFLRSDVNCVDTTPAPPPTDFFVRWDEKSGKTTLTWNFPIDTRRHIKYFQVFRRKNIGNVRPAQLPFELVRMYDFNNIQQGNSVFYQTSPNGNFQFIKGEDNISPDLIVAESSVNKLDVFTPTCFVDEDFTKEDYFIYAVAAVDAHGITTNYSNQIGVKYNSRKNDIDRVDVSIPNAPKPYPNLYLNKDAFVDTIKNEGYSQVTVVFNPDYLTLKRQTGEDLGLWNYGTSNLYRLQLINTDLQQDQWIDINIINDRTAGSG